MRWRRQVEIVLLAAALMLAAVSGALTFGPLPAVDTVSADKVVYGDFESGDVTTEGWSDPNNGFAAVKTRSVSGNYSVEAQSSADVSKPELEYTSFNDSPNSLSGYFYYDSYGGFKEVYGLSTRTNGNRVYGLGVGTNGNLRVHDSNSYNTDTGIDIPKDTWYKLSIENIDYSNCTYDVYVYNKDGSQYASSTGYSFENCVNSIDELWLEHSTDGRYFADFIATDGAEIGQDVSGTIENADGNAIANARVEIRNRSDGSVVESTTTNSSGDYSFSGISDGEYTLRASADGYQKESKEFDVAGAAETVNLTLSKTNPPYVSSRSPSGGFQNITTNSINLNATVDDDEGDLINATIYYNDGQGGDGYQDVASETDLQPGEEVNASVQPEFGLEQRWKVEVSDGANTVNSSVYRFQPPGRMTILNGTDFTKLNSTTVEVTLADADGDWTETRTTSDGILNLTGLPKPWVVSDVSASGFENQNILIDDRAGVYFPVLYEDGTNGTYEQCFQLDDFTGNYQTDSSALQIEKRVNGEYEVIGSEPFDATGEACVQLKGGEEYRVSVINLGGDSRQTGGFTGNQSQDTVRLPIYERGTDDAVRTTLYTWDAYWTEDANGDRADINWMLDLAENVSAENVTLRIYERGNESNEIHNQTFGSLGQGASVSHLELLNNTQQNESWVVVWSADVQNGTGGTEAVSGRKVLGAGGEDQWPALPDWLGHYAAMALLLMTGAAITRSDVKVGVLIVPALAGILWFAGLLTNSVLTGGAVALALGLGAVLSYSGGDQF